MPKVKQYSAAWLSGNAPGRQLFEPSADSIRYRALSPSFASKKQQQQQQQQQSGGPRRTIARRGTEIFVAVGREIRWADLIYLRDDWVAKQPRERGVRVKREEDSLSPFDGESGLDSAAGFRTLKTPVADDIRQLVISPDSSLLAILTTHTVHICVLPDSSHLTAKDTSPMRPSIFTLGPTTHVTSRSPIASAVWHPLGVKGSCIVTVTTDAIVRLWELSPTDRWTYDLPTTSIDLKRLADGTNLDQDFAPAGATNKSFSPDSFEMEVAAATFPSRGSGGWSPMTLWVAMREGDVYALCPLLPKRWAPPPTLIPSLSVSVVTTVAAIEDDARVDDREKLLAQQQLQWMAELDAQEPQVLDTGHGERLVEVYSRPQRPGAIPRLQGPFDLVADPQSSDDLDVMITDVLVIGNKTETDRLMMGEEDEGLDLDLGESDEQGLSLTIVCLVSTSGQVRVYLDTDGVQAQWLPPKSSKPRPPGPATEPPRLLALQAIDTMTPVEVSDEAWPVFSTDVTSRYSFFVTHHAAITCLSLTSWIFRLEGELDGDHEAGADFRIGLLAKAQSGRDRIYGQSAADVSVPLAGCVAMRDPDLGYFVLSATPYDAVALTLETPETEAAPASRFMEASLSPEASIMAPLEFYEPRPAFNPPYAFAQESALPTLLERLKSSRHKTAMSQEVKLSPLTLQIMTEAHRVLSEETYKLGVAAAELFRRCDLLQTEVSQQVGKAAEVMRKIDAMSGGGGGDGDGDDDDDDGESDRVAYDRRIVEAQERRNRLTERMDGLRKLLHRAAAPDLSIKERAWSEEVRSLSSSVLGDSSDSSSSTTTTTTITTTAAAAAAATSDRRQPWRRFDEASGLRTQLATDAAHLAKDVAGQQTPPADKATTAAASDLGIPKEVRRKKMQLVQGMLARESALVEALAARLERLQTGI
ncbi:WD40 repeat-like-containing domain protein [Ophiocordyceps camponoti-floridani]|uniref:WD40 repeat-like-containing domain protein n=1 Tax=Ophiocordyceps camponoti-floridani TaxID=2030778 RepID=A0A8H4Q9D1_9HYPO|nr:WD40 repeat-like-containing domain protein [Ophiocordyceps camponoti-floridani]